VHRESARRGCTRTFIAEARLADPGLAGDEQQPTAAAAQLVERSGKLRQLAVATEQKP
jgi:hypothetical protein